MMGRSIVEDDQRFAGSMRLAKLRMKTSRFFGGYDWTRREW